jgi:diaminopimelate decarboxylase
MPMSEEFKQALFPHLKKIADYYRTPFHILFEKGIVDTGIGLNHAFRDIYGFQEFFAVKANSNPRILDIMCYPELDFGFDCSSSPELSRARKALGKAGITNYEDYIIFTSNNTDYHEFHKASKGRGCIINLDDITLIDKLLYGMPELICFRYNPGDKRQGGGHIFGNPSDQKYGIAHWQIVDACKLAMEKGAKRFGLHTMVVSNELNHEYMIETVAMLCEVAEEIKSKLGIQFEFFNMGGGIGIPYRPWEKQVDIIQMAERIKEVLDTFKQKNGYLPKLYMESGRYITGPQGVLVTTVINQKHIYKEYVGVDASMPCNPRPGMYGPDSNDVYHHITVLGKENDPISGKADVVGSLCENCDKFAVDRELPKIEVGDIFIIEDTGAHAIEMGSKYNGRFPCKQLLLRRDGSVQLIRREDTEEDYDRPYNDFESNILIFE